MKNIAIFASGEGSNAEAIAQYFANNDKVCVKCVLTNRQNAGVNQRMEKGKTRHRHSLLSQRVVEQCTRNSRFLAKGEYTFHYFGWLLS